MCSRGFLQRRLCICASSALQRVSEWMYLRTATVPRTSLHRFGVPGGGLSMAETGSRRKVRGSPTSFPKWPMRAPARRHRAWLRPGLFVYLTVRRSSPNSSVRFGPECISAGLYHKDATQHSVTANALALPVSDRIIADPRRTIRDLVNQASTLN